MAMSAASVSGRPGWLLPLLQGFFSRLLLLFSFLSSSSSSSSSRWRFFFASVVAGVAAVVGCLRGVLADEDGHVARTEDGWSWVDDDKTRGMAGGWGSFGRSFEPDGVGGGKKAASLPNHADDAADVSRLPPLPSLAPPLLLLLFLLVVVVLPLPLPLDLLLWRPCLLLLLLPAPEFTTVLATAAGSMIGRALMLA